MKSEHATQESEKEESQKIPEPDRATEDQRAPDSNNIASNKAVEAPADTS